MSTNSIAKAKLRKTLQSRRQALSYPVVLRRSQAIVEHLTQLVDWSDHVTISIFLPIRPQHEVDLSAFMAWLHAQYRPKLYAAGLAPDGEAAHFGYAPGDTLRPGKFGLPTPNGPSTSSLQFDVILIPALGFDDAGYRLGYGGGYYDRLLATQAQALRVGVCFELGHQQSLPHEPHDQVLHYMVTERSVYTYV